ncbi:MAG: DUF2336 domain-containing protein, partial [Actinobacteria bacterium]|nr:DUF2336 domain-containing protein [Actinomycetota bacterium]
LSDVAATMAGDATASASVEQHSQNLAEIACTYLSRTADTPTPPPKAPSEPAPITTGPQYEPAPRVVPTPSSIEHSQFLYGASQALASLFVRFCDAHSEITGTPQEIIESSIDARLSSGRLQLPAGMQRQELLGRTLAYVEAISAGTSPAMPVESAISTLDAFAPAEPAPTVEVPSTAPTPTPEPEPTPQPVPTTETEPTPKPESVVNLTALLAAGDTTELFEALQSDTLDFAAQLQIISEGTPAQRLALATAGITLDDRVVSELLADSSPYVRNAVAGYRELGALAIRVLANDEDDGVRMSIANRKDLPPQVIEKLAMSPEHNVRWAIADRPGLPAHVVERLAADQDPLVSSSILKHYNYRSQPQRSQIMSPTLHPSPQDSAPCLHEAIERLAFAATYLGGAIATYGTAHSVIEALARSNQVAYDHLAQDVSATISNMTGGEEVPGSEEEWLTDAVVCRSAAMVKDIYETSRLNPADLSDAAPPAVPIWNTASRNLTLCTPSKEDLAISPVEPNAQRAAQVLELLAGSYLASSPNPIFPSSLIATPTGYPSSATTLDTSEATTNTRVLRAIYAARFGTGKLCAQGTCALATEVNPAATSLSKKDPSGLRDEIYTSALSAGWERMVCWSLATASQKGEPMAPDHVLASVHKSAAFRAIATYNREIPSSVSTNTGIEVQLGKVYTHEPESSSQAEELITKKQEAFARLVAQLAPRLATLPQQFRESVDSALSALAEGEDPTPPANPERKYWRDFCKSAPIGRAYEFMASAKSAKQPMALNVLCAKALSYLQGSGSAPQAAKDAVCDAALLSYGTELYPAPIPIAKPQMAPGQHYALPLSNNHQRPLPSL